MGPLNTIPEMPGAEFSDFASTNCHERHDLWVSDLMPDMAFYGSDGSWVSFEYWEMKSRIGVSLKMTQNKEPMCWGWTSSRRSRLQAQSSIENNGSVEQENSWVKWNPDILISIWHNRIIKVWPLSAVVAYWSDHANLDANSLRSFLVIALVANFNLVCVEMTSRVGAVPL